MKKLFLPLLLVLGITATAQVKIGNNPTAIGISSVLELEHTSKALLLTRVNSVTDIATPIKGMLVYDIFKKCVRSYDNNVWSSCIGGYFPPGNIEANVTCVDKPISKTPCSLVPVAVLNDSIGTSGIEYDWAYATDKRLGFGFGVATNVRSLVEIGGQCWARLNSRIQPVAGGEVGYYNDRGSLNNGNPTSQSSLPIDASEGLLYFWNAGMNGQVVERSQAICPVSWHVPSDCEWMFLENFLGMNTSDQQSINTAVYGTRPSGSVGDRLKVGGGTGFELHYSGYYYGGSYNGYSYGSEGYLWSSSQNGFGNAIMRGSIGPQFSTPGLIRNSQSQSSNRIGLGIRCIKD